MGLSDFQQPSILVTTRTAIMLTGARKKVIVSRFVPAKQLQKLLLQLLLTLLKPRRSQLLICPKKRLLRKTHIKSLRKTKICALQSNGWPEIALVVIFLKPT